MVSTRSAVAVLLSSNIQDLLEKTQHFTQDKIARKIPFYFRIIRDEAGICGQTCGWVGLTVIKKKTVTLLQTGIQYRQMRPHVIRNKQQARAVDCAGDGMAPLAASCEMIQRGALGNGTAAGSSL